MTVPPCREWCDCWFLNMGLACLHGERWCIVRFASAFAKLLGVALPVLVMGTGSGRTNGSRWLQLVKEKTRAILLHRIRLRSPCELVGDGFLHLRSIAYLRISCNRLVRALDTPSSSRRQEVEVRRGVGRCQAECQANRSFHANGEQSSSSSTSTPRNVD